jgi:hypothetical protein
MTSTNLWLAAVEDLKQAFDAADGLKADLARRGYSETAQETIATQFILVVFQNIARS